MFKRMGRDSNPRWTFAHAGFQDRCLKPLGHPSKCRSLGANLHLSWMSFVIIDSLTPSHIVSEILPCQSLPQPKNPGQTSHSFLMRQAVGPRSSIKASCPAPPGISNKSIGLALGTCRQRRCVERGCSKIRHARRSVTQWRPSASRTYSPACRRFAGLRSFPRRPLVRSPYPTPHPPRDASAESSLSPVPSACDSRA